MIEFEELKYMKALLDEEVLMPLPDDFDERLHQKLLEVASQKDESDTIGKAVTNKIRRLSWKSRALGGIAAVLVIGVIAYNQVFPYGFYMGASSSKSMATSVSSDASMPETAPQAYGENTIAFDEVTTEEAMVTASARGMDDSAEYTTATASDSGSGDYKTSETSAYRENRIIVRTANLSIDVETYDETVAAIKAMLEGTEGYIESEQTNYKTRYTDRDNLRYGNFVLRVPVGMFDQMLTTIKEQGFVNYDNVTSEDVTKYYRDTAAQVENYKITESRLREILEKATDVSDILEIENELTRTRENIDALTNQLKNWENLADLSYMYVEIDEVESLNPVIAPIDDSVLTRAKDGFIDTINKLVETVMAVFVWIIAKSPLLLILAILAWVGTKFWHMKKPKKLS
jgi:hypothetical protein